MISRQTWRQLLLQHYNDYLSWLAEKSARQDLLKLLADQLSQFLISVLTTPENCKEFWSVIPDIRSACNDITYAKPYAIEAYAYVHLLDRYWRTWDVLIELTKTAALPLGKEGVRILDVGTGPAPTPYAISDFYELLREYGVVVGSEELAQQTTHFTIVERNTGMCGFMNRFNQTMGRSGPFRADIDDFSIIDFASKRIGIYYHLLDEEYYDSERDEHFLEYSPEEANYIAQQYARYRMVVFSNFLTLSDSVQTFEKPLRALLSDLQTGSVVIVLGGRSSRYNKIYCDFADIANEYDMFALSDLPDELGRDDYAIAAPIIKQAQYNVYKHLEKIVGQNQLEFLGSSEYPDYKYPDYCSPAPNPKKRVDFALRVFRKGRWPKQLG